MDFNTLGSIASLESRETEATSRDSASSGQFDDRIPDGRRQTVPPGDQLAECHAVPTQFRQALGALVASYL
jgi:hypothetical protein